MSALGAALVTGGGQRIGRALALAAADAGYAVAVHYRGGEDAARDTVAAIEAAGGRAVALTADLADAKAPGRLIDVTAQAVGPLTLLVNNASVFEPDEATDFTREGWARHLDTNLHAPVALAQAFAAQLPAGADGLVVNLLDQRVLKPSPPFFTYGLSKAALWWATRTLAQALAPRVRVNGIGPGPTLKSVHQSEAEFTAEADATLLKRRGSPEQIAGALRYLIDAPMVTGQMIAVDAGQHLLWRTEDF